jgi:hypothetical protein
LRLLSSMQPPWQQDAAAANPRSQSLQHSHEQGWEASPRNNLWERLLWLLDTNTNTSITITWLSHSIQPPFCLCL